MGVCFERQKKGAVHSHRSFSFPRFPLVAAVQTGDNGFPTADEAGYKAESAGTSVDLGRPALRISDLDLRDFLHT